MNLYPDNHLNHPVTGILLAGGNSTRMGMSKGFIALGGRRLVDIALENLSAVCSEIIISANEPEYAQFGFPVIADIHANIGPMGGIYSALNASKNKMNLVLSVDLPFVNSGLLRFIIQNLEYHQAAVPWFGGSHYEPLCACYEINLLQNIRYSVENNNYKLPDLFEEIDIQRIVIDDKLPFYHPHLFMNVNTKQDLEKAKTLKSEIGGFGN